MEIIYQIIGAARKVSPSPGLVAEAFQHVFANAFESEAVTDAD